MKGKVFIVLLVFGFLTVGWAFKNVFLPAHQVQVSFGQKLESFYLQTQNFRIQAENFKQGLVTLKEIQNELAKTRSSYKEVAFILEYYYPSFVEENLNGAPLLHMERFGTRPIVNPPQGLQVLDELLYGDLDYNQKSEIQIQARRLENKSREIFLGVKSLKLKDGEVLEAIRENLLSVFTLGVTGFDTPGSLQGLEEAKKSTEAMAAALVPYLKVCTDKSLVAEIENRLELNRVLLSKAKSFDSLDRLGYLKQVINPLYSAILELRHAMGYDVSIKTGRNPEAVNLFSNNILDPYFYTELTREEDSDNLRALGEKIFYDAALSSNGKMSCATCHQPEKAFTDGLPKSESNVEGQTVKRNAPTLINAVYSDRYFYDLRAFTLEQQVEHVVFNSAEFNTAIEEIVSKINQSSNYKPVVKAINKSETINRDLFAKALSSYVLSLRGFNSPFDLFVRGESDTLNKNAREGFNVFMGKGACATCHFPPTFSGLVPPKFTKNESEILGVLTAPKGWSRTLDPDSGRFVNGIYNEQAWIFERSFKTAGIRNVKETAPYFHNGAYKSLQEVVDFYDHGGGGGLGLEVKNQTLASDSLQLTSLEKIQLIAFMNSLSNIK